MSYLGFLVRTLWTRKPRFILSTGAVLVIGLLCAYCFSIYLEFQLPNSNTGTTQLVTDGAGGFGERLPLAYAQRIAKIPGVEHINYFDFFGATAGTDSTPFAVNAVSPMNLKDLTDGTIIEPKSAAQKWLGDRIGILVGMGLENKFHWTLGTSLELTSKYLTTSSGNHSLQVRVDGFYYNQGMPANKIQAIMMHYDYFDSARLAGQDQVMDFTETLHDPKAIAKVASEIDKLFINSSTPTNTAPADLFALQSYRGHRALRQSALGVALAGLICLILLLSTAAFLNAQHQAKDLALLRALGFQPWRVALLIIAEIACPMLVGMLLSLALWAIGAYPASGLIGKYLPSINLHVPAVVGMTAIALVVITLFSLAFPLSALKRLTATTRLREAHS